MDYKRLRKLTFKQHDKSDCGIAALLMAIRHFGADASIEALRDSSGTSKTGTTMLGICQAAAKLGVEAEGYSADLEQLRACEAVCILHVVAQERYYHYVVCWGYDEGASAFVISDPGTGQVEQLKTEALEKVWKSKKLILLKPTEKLVKVERSEIQKWRWLANLAEPEGNLLFIAFVLGGISAILSLSTAIFSQQLVDFILPSKEQTRLVAGLILLLILLFARSGLSYIRKLFILRQAKVFNIRILNYFFGNLLYLPKPFFDNRTTGDFIARMNDTKRIQSVISFISTNASIDLLLVIITLFAIAIYHWSVALICVLWLPFYYLIVRKYHRQILGGQIGVMSSYADSESYYIDAIQGIGTIKLLGRQNRFKEVAATIYKTFQEKIYQLGIITIKLNFFLELIGTILVTLILLVCSLLVLRGAITVGAILAILQMLGMLIVASGKLALLDVQIQGARVALDRMQAFTALQPEFQLEQDIAKEKTGTFSKLELQQLCFRFPGRSFLLQNVSMEVNRGEILAILGETGSGKSTLLQIIQGFYSVNSGNIHVNGHNLNACSISHWREQLGVVEQETKLFNGTIAENILIGKEKLEMESFFQFLKAHNLENFLRQFPNGVNTVVGDGGVKISGGQKQIIGLIRALYRSPGLLLLDEPTAALDSATEAFVLNILTKIKQHTGIVLLTHRNRVAAIADKTYRIQNKSLVEVKEVF